MKLSVIICVYNTKKEFLTECLDSITRSSVKDLEGGYEICFIDDGSEADYSDIAEKYSVKYIKTENRGILAARELGASVAEGEYSVYCDSDDTVSWNYYLPMVNAASEKHADIVINDWATETNKTRYYCKNDDTVRNDFDISGDDILLEFVKNEGSQHSFYVLWNKLYRTELLRRAFASLRAAGMTERVSYSEDAAINFFIWRDAKKLINLHTGYYFYRIHPTQTVNAVTEDKLRSQINSMAQTLSVMRERIGENSHKELISGHIQGWGELMARSHYSIASAEGYSALYPLISKKYGVAELRKSTARDGAAYAKQVLFGENYSELEELFLRVWNSEHAVPVYYCGRNKYIRRSLEYLVLCGKAKPAKKNADIVIPNYKNSFKQRLLHNAFLYKLGLVFFKKGSRARNFLKKFL